MEGENISRPPLTTIRLLYIKIAYVYLFPRVIQALKSFRFAKWVVGFSSKLLSWEVFIKWKLAAKFSKVCNRAPLLFAAKE